MANLLLEPKWTEARRSRTVQAINELKWTGKIPGDFNFVFVKDKGKVFVAFFAGSYQEALRDGRVLYAHHTEVIAGANQRHLDGLD